MATVYSPAIATYKVLADITLTASATEVIMTGFGSSYRDLILVIEGNGTAGGDRLHTMYFNGDFTNANYDNVRILADNNGSGADVTDSPRIGNIHASTRIMCQVNIYDYSVTDKFKTFIARSDMAGDRLYFDNNSWNNTDAIQSITVRPDAGSSYASGMSFKLFGVEA